MRYVVIPSDVVFDNLPEHPITKKPQSMNFVALVRNVLVQDPKVTADHAAIDRYLALADVVKDLKPGDVWSLTDEDHEWLSGVARGFAYNPDLKLQILHLVRAITGAATKKPGAKA